MKSMHGFRSTHRQNRPKSSINEAFRGKKFSSYAGKQILKQHGAGSGDEDDISAVKMGGRSQGGKRLLQSAHPRKKSPGMGLSRNAAKNLNSQDSPTNLDI